MTFYLYSALLLNLLPQLGFAASSTFYPGDGNSFGRPNQNATYDYVIVGGGTAGLAVAMRLAEDPSYTVAVIEAGGFYQIESGNQSVVPAYNSEFQALYDPTANPTVDWGFVTTPQSGANNRSLHYARGKTLGSSSALNANIYNRGTEAPISNGLTLWGTIHMSLIIGFLFLRKAPITLFRTLLSERQMLLSPHLSMFLRTIVAALSIFLIATSLYHSQAG